MTPLIINNKNIGLVDKEHKLFIKEVSRAKHLFKKMQAWGIDARVFEKLIERGYDVVVHDRDTNGRYRQSAKVIKEKGTYLHFKGHGAQIFLPLEMWEK